MKPRELFDVFVRTIGVVVLVYGLWDLSNAALFYADYWRNPDMTFRFYLISGWVSIAIGLLLTRVPEILTNFAFGTADESGLINRETSNEIESDQD